MTLNPVSKPLCHLVPLLPLARYRVRFGKAERDDGTSLASLRSGYLGSAWRGAFGRALRRAVCVTRLPVCDPCVLLRSCPYPWVFESRTPPGATKLSRYPRTPGPFVLEPADCEFDAAGDGIHLGVTLFGPANEQLPYVVHALEQAGRSGLTSRRVKLDLVDVQVEAHEGASGGYTAAEEVDVIAKADGSHKGGGGPNYASGPASASENVAGAEHLCAGGASFAAENTDQSDWATIFEPGGHLAPALAESPPPPPAPVGVNVRLLTLLRLRRDERLVNESNFDFRTFMGGLLRRISLLTAFFSDTPLDTDFAGLLARAETVQVTDCHLGWRDWTRYSSRQRTTLKMGGMVGRFRIEGSGLNSFWPYLWLGQWTHCGKGSSMGLGRYVLEPVTGGPSAEPDGAATVSWPSPRRL